MANSLVEMYRIKDLRKKIFITLGLLIVSRIGAVIPIPGIDPEVLKLFFLSQSSSSNIGLTEYLNFFSGGAFSNFSLFMLGVMPYISTQIIVQLLMLVIPSLKKLAQDPSGHKKIQQYTRYGTIVVCLIQSYVVTIYANSIPGVMTMGVLPFTLVAMLTVTTGSMLLIWIGNKITQWGIGNGISLLIFAGIVARFPEAMSVLFRSISAGVLNPIVVLVVFVMFLVVVALVVYEEQGVRKIPVNYAKRVVGRKMYGAQSTYIPIKVNPSGVIPVIFASALLSFPLQIATTLGPEVRWLAAFANWLNPQGAPYLIIYALLIIAFAFFYTQVSMNPVEMAKQIRENGGSVPGVRSEKLEEYLTRVLNRIVLPGSIFLAFIALIPTLVQKFFNFPSTVAMLFGGTSLLILVGVDLDTMRQIEGVMKMHHYDGFNVGGRKSKHI
ncbi:MAG TPA: preprotein translocase subunit SecY [Sphaerochaeta sp.]|jgi:preprotein translocase subunit SecY|uniref:preprotein translocase subunit SecY n=1 Tax=unclassified Sphaerochaeta TaxID=2637943 RepID=UPI000E904E25|nr:MULTISPECIES: preprotein translocase subunit SecY [unclassified Sphaerochaeta]MCK9598229.1 preprotein translocase subunit SecY [Sphaerochaeta sp.]MDX9823333.1 preprotein translocase subunit SecY [Sphaerochaeta sp.]HAP56717.1 preprotein translocase subunit SecY [Sphaerochaeta sp.]HBO35949.1 preprotein translocase subunit SecY [Sphaerochaeta sp.]HCU29413.1 preprotein translocase subunit SecY [Sphaerochaeta sp.]